jgi:hypothetical protein
MKQWTERDTTGRSGIVKLDRVVTDMGYIWRSTPNSDVGIDGETELVEDRAATAKIIKVQVKSGPIIVTFAKRINARLSCMLQLTFRREGIERRPKAKENHAGMAEDTG